VFTIDFGVVEPIRGVALHLGAGRAGVEWPTSIQIYVSDTGKSLSLVGDLMELLARRPPEKGYAAMWLMAEGLETHGRFVKFVCWPTDLGNGVYIFLDEMEIYRGDDAWLKRALAAPYAPERWLAAWQEIKWRDQAAATPEAVRPTRLRPVDAKSQLGGDAPLQQGAVEKNRMSFTLNGEERDPEWRRWGRWTRLSQSVLPDSPLTAGAVTSVALLFAQSSRPQFPPAGGCCTGKGWMQTRLRCPEGRPNAFVAYTTYLESGDKLK